MNQNQPILANSKLLLHIQFPDLEDVWLEGYEDAMAKVDEMTNPYPIGTIEHFYWSDGWWSATYEEAPLFNLDGSTVDSHAKPGEIIEINFRQAKKPLSAHASNEANLAKSDWKNVAKITASLLVGGAVASVAYDLLT